jgi:hypothetical protein
MTVEMKISDSALRSKSRLFSGFSRRGSVDMLENCPSRGRSSSSRRVLRNSRRESARCIRRIFWHANMQFYCSEPSCSWQLQTECLCVLRWGRHLYPVWLGGNDASSLTRSDWKSSLNLVKLECKGGCVFDDRVHILCGGKSGMSTESL